jgi:DNA topoisomerase-3
LFDLTSLQKECNRLFGLTAKETLDAAQELYEKHKALSYPRTDCRYLSVSVAHTLPAIVKAIAPSYAGFVAANSGELPKARWVDDAKIGDHHALIPTAVVPQQLSASSPAALVYDLVCRRMLMMWHPELLEAVTRLLTEVREGGVADLYASQGTSVEAAGWTILELRAAGPSERERQPKLPGGLVQGAIQQVVDVTVHRKATRPPHSYTEATLLAAMEVPGRNVTDDALREILRDSALGTPATRAATIEKLLDSGCLERFKTTLKSTRHGRALIAAVSEQVASAEMTGRWEQRLRRIERGEESLESFMRDIEAYVRETVRAEEAKPIAAKPMAARPLRGKRGAKRKRNGSGRKSTGLQ